MSLFDALKSETWMQQALCREVGGDMWFADGKGESLRPAKKICQLCDVKDECLAYAMENDVPWGVWGGLAPRQRQKLRTRRADVCRNGHAFDEENTYVHEGRRYCRACTRLRDRARRAA